MYKTESEILENHHLKREINTLQKEIWKKREKIQ